MKTQGSNPRTKQPSPLKPRNENDAIVSGEIKEILSQDLSAKDEQLHTINEFLKNESAQKKTYFQLQDVFNNNKNMNRNKYNNLSFQKRTSDAVETTNQWKGYVNTMNQDFFDQNKLYLKSV